MAVEARLRIIGQQWTRGRNLRGGDQCRRAWWKAARRWRRRLLSFLRAAALPQGGHRRAAGRRMSHLSIPIRVAWCRVLAHQTDMTSTFEIDRFTVGAERVFVIAEIGNNHNGSIALAKALVDAAIDAGADCVKFQLRNREALYRD